LIGAVRTQLKKRHDLAAMSEKRLDDLRENIILALPHELRTPLTSILGFSDIIATDCHERDPEQIIEMAQYINYAGSRLFRLAENYLAYAQLQVMLTNTEWLDVLRACTTPDARYIIEQTVLQKAQEVQRETDLQIEIKADAAVKVLGDHLKKIVEELVDNALKFSAWGSPITVKADINRGRYRIEIMDHGRGMSAEQISAVGAYMQFERKWFEQQGLGLGLIIAKRLSELYGGEISIESVPDTFTHVTISLPLA
jgi:signal transduction histidine kinase